jgi:rhodanese-related sulfurtransferase
LTPALRQGLAILALSCVVGFGANALRKEPLAMRGSLDPPPEPEPGADLPAITADEARTKWEEGALFVDARAREEWDAAHATGAAPLDASAFPQSYFDLVPPLDPAIPLIVYGAGPDSFAVRRLAAGLGEMGHADVSLVVKGLSELEGAGIPVEKGEMVP